MKNRLRMRANRLDQANTRGYSPDAFKLTHTPGELARNFRVSKPAMGQQRGSRPVGGSVGDFRL